MTLCVALGLWCAAASGARADDGPALHWSPRWTRFTPTQYALTLAMAGGTYATNTWMHSSPTPHWNSGILLDNDARSVFASNSLEGRNRASSLSDYLAYGLLAYPFVIDTALFAGVVYGSPDVAWQMAMMGLQAVVVAKLVSGLTKNLVGRARPDYARCEAGDDSACSAPTQSFVSGHTTTAFVGAGLICANHQNLRLYGSATAGAIACGLSLGAATTVGALRMVADRHYLSDVLGGAALGLAAGYLLPNLFNYDFGRSHGFGGGTLSPFAGRGAVGLSYAGQF